MPTNWREGAPHGQYRSEAFIYLTLDTLESLISIANCELHIHRWQQVIGCCNTSLVIPKSSPGTAKYCFSLTKEKFIKLLGIVTGHCTLKKHLYRLYIVNDPTCKGCNDENKTLEHLLCYCSVLVELRGAMLEDHYQGCWWTCKLANSLCFEYQLACGMMTPGPKKRKHNRSTKI